MTPTKGRIVMYTNLGDAQGKYLPEDHPAIITDVKPIGREYGDSEEGDFHVWMCVLYKTGFFFMEDPVTYSDIGLVPGTWTWPPRV